MSHREVDNSYCFTLEKFSGQNNYIFDIINLEKKIFSKNDSWAEIVTSEIKKRNILTIVAIDKHKKVCGYIICNNTGINLHVSKIAVREDFRRRGVAKSLMENAMTTAARERRSCSSTLHVAVDNTPAISLYKSMGYSEDGRLVDYYRPGRDALKLLIDITHLKN